jgi:hypothetical protein
MSKIKNSIPMEVVTCIFSGEPNFYRSYHLGYKIAIVRGPLGCLCGYVKIPQGHPFYRKNYWDKIMPHIRVHGSITYGSIGCPTGKGYAMRGFWIGFDCGHYRDYVPAYDLYSSSKTLNQGNIYRDFEYVLNEVHSMVKQVDNFRRKK